jgi:hypothetical protein
MQLDNQAAIREQLSSGEHILWSGAPLSGVRLRKADAFRIPFSLMWGGFAIFWEVTAITSGAPVFFWLWGIPFVLIGLYLIVGRFFFEAYRRANTFYGVTNERVLIVTKGLGARVKSLNLRTLSDVTLSGSANERGSLTFGSSPWGTAAWLGGSGWPGVQAAPSFELIEHPRRVYDVVREAQRKAT